MRIESPFHDYYDCIQAHGVDQTLVYNRRPEIVKSSAVILGDPDKLRVSWRRDNGPLRISHLTVGFCGKCYPLFRLSSDKDYEVEALCYDMEDVDRFIEANFKKREIAAYRNTDKVFRSSDWTGYHRRTNFVKFLESCEGKENSYERLFRKHNAPMFISTYKGDHWTASGRISESEIEYHGCLKDVEFFRIIDSYTAYQEIQMYLTGILGLTSQHKAKYQGQLIEPELDDITKRDSKGFDKWSFRKEPTKKKR